MRHLPSVALVLFALGCADAFVAPAPDASPPNPGCEDRDQDGYGEGKGCRDLDCDDSDQQINPGALERCDGVDNNCNGEVDEALVGRVCALRRGVCAGATQRCVEGLWATCGGKNYGPDFEPEETRCDGLDNDCDGFVDEGCGCEPGQTQACGQAEGECSAGSQSCIEGSWGPCSEVVGPAEEICDGLDNDCDGLTDEDLEGSGPNCPLSEGVCAGARRVCAGAAGWGECDAAIYGELWTAEEGAAHCDGLDNDCDGLTDEGCGCAEGEVQPCGSSVGACELGTQVCAGGVWGACRGGLEPTEERCGGGDDDCDGEVDEGLSAPPCARNQGVCAGTVQRCDPGGWAACVDGDYLAHDGRYVPVETADHCDGLDNDCDGNVDEACECAVDATQNCGVNEGLCTQGQQRCVGGRWGPCDGVAPVAELCNGLDDDCDGRTDEDLEPPPCPMVRGVCAGAVQQCVAGVLVCGEAAYGPNWAPVEVRCDGLDNDCDGVVDEGCACAPEDMQRCGSDTGACTRGSQGCVAGQWGPCEGAIEPIIEVCNGIDDDCDEDIDEALEAPPCPLQQGVCAGATQRCEGEAGWSGSCGAAEYGARYTAEEGGDHCDGQDNDCDGQIDEGCGCNPADPRPVCGSAVGVCETGLLRCEAGAFTECEGEVAPVPELCNGLDDDCDGELDENVERPACPLQMGVCANSRAVCDGEAGFAPCGTNRGYPDTHQDNENLCDGLDNDCDGLTDEGCEPPVVLINEVLYDGPGADGPNEFIELVGLPGAFLNGLVLQAVNGASGEIYREIPLVGQIPATQYYLIVEAGTPASPGASGTLLDIADLVVRGADLQNGPDSLRLMFNGQIIDALAYGEFEHPENAAGEGDPAPDAANTSLTRVVEGRDTNDNATDFEIADVPTPRGAPLPQVHVALRWASEGTDFDLHYLREGAWQSEDDCHWGNRRPPWGARFERDDTDGLGPEFVDHGTPAPGRYLVEVQYYSAPTTGPDTATVGVFVDGMLVLEVSRELNAATPFWAAAQIEINAGEIVVGEVDLVDGEPFAN